MLLAAVLPVAGADFKKEIRPLLTEYCIGCHSTEKHKGDLDLEPFTSLGEVKKSPKIWQAVVEQLSLDEMPPKDKPQPSPAQRARLIGWANAMLDEVALSRRGDPGPVVLRRLSNAEYTYTIRDLTGVATLDPAKEFPADSASGEGFMNVGNSLVMSPSLVTKYLDAGKAVATHGVLLPDGIRFSPSTSQRDWTEETLASIRSFYGRFTVNGGGGPVNLQGIKFDTKDGGVLPLASYLQATLQDRDALKSKKKTIAASAKERGLNAKYLETLWRALNHGTPSPLLDPLRARWRGAKPSEATELANDIAVWQAALWRFTQVGHIGKRDGPSAWQVPVTPLASAREIRLKIQPPSPGKDVTLYLAVSDAGDGDQNDFAVWENPRLVTPGRSDLALRDIRAAVAELTASREKVASSAARCLAAVAEVRGHLDDSGIVALARKHGVDSGVLAAWLDCLGIGAGEARIDSPLTQKTESMQNYDFIKGWTGADALSVLANSSDQHVRVPGNMKPRGIAVHPSPKQRVAIGWRSPVAAALRIEGVAKHAHPECGNGVTWAVELRRGHTRLRLAAGTAQGAKEAPFGPLQNVSVNPGDIVSVVVGPRDGNHSCDLTAIDFKLHDGTREWDLGKEVSPNILAGNPHADSFGNAGVWHFYSEADKGASEPVLPSGSLLARWQSSSAPEERRRLAEAVQNLLTGAAAGLAKDAPDAVLHRQLTSLNGPLLSSMLRVSGKAAFRSPNPGPGPTAETREMWGVDPASFGRHPEGGRVGETSLCVRAPSVVAVRLPADLVEGCEFVATGRLHQETGSEGSVQMQVLTTEPAARPGLVAGGAKELGGKSTWSDGERPVISDSPILVSDGSAARKRLESALHEFRQLFPAALCYTKIVPVDEVVTLTLYYREDEALRRLMLDEVQAAEIDRLWAELRYVSQDALKLVDAFEQLWQYATQDADPSAFTPMREPIKQRAEEFRTKLVDTQPKHLDAVLRFADGAYRRPLTTVEKDELTGLYRGLRAQEIAHEQAIRLTLARVLVSPAFLYRAEKSPPGSKPGPVDDLELATRLSYFLWSSSPDAELRAAAASGKLRRSDELNAQARRLLRDPRARRLATEFACAWLHVHGFDELGEKSERHFPTFASLRGAMYEETIRFFTDLFQRDGSVLEIIDADHTFLNQALAKHYDLPDDFFRRSGDGSGESLLAGDGWKRVEGVKQFGRGGILAQSTTLAKQSGASRTSPILRGNWLCEVLLGDKLPRPPKDVPILPEDEAVETLTMRELTQKHSSDPKCYGCHRRIDPYGYSLEGFDSIGRRRERDLGGRPVDTRVKAMDGSEFNGLEGLRQHLLTTRREAFLKQFCRKLLGYALGRGVILSDGPLIAEMRSRLESQNYRVGAAMEAILRSKQFREIRGKEMAAGD